MQAIELFHAAALAPILTSSTAITLKRLESGTDKDWAVYNLNDSIDVFVMCNTHQINNQRSLSVSWVFDFTEDMLGCIKGKDEKYTYLMLVCVMHRSGLGDVPVCFIQPSKLGEILGFRKKRHKLVVKLPKGRKLFRLFNDRCEEFLVQRSSLEKLQFPQITSPV